MQSCCLGIGSLAKQLVVVGANRASNLLDHNWYILISLLAIHGRAGNADFVRRVARRYGDKVEHWAVENEITWRGNFEGSPEEIV